jgi:hypothetical protein
MYKCLLALDYLHSRGLCHNGLSSFCIWMSTTNQLELAEVEIKITDLGRFIYQSIMWDNKSIMWDDKSIMWDNKSIMWDNK